MGTTTRSLGFMLAVLLVFAPVASLQKPAEAFYGYHQSPFMASLRIIPALVGAGAGAILVSQFGVPGRVVGGLLGFMVGKFVGKFISRQVGDVVYDPYPFPYAPGSTGSVVGPMAPSSSAGTPTSATSVAALRERWLAALKSYQRALQTGDQGQKLAAKGAHDQALAEYQAAKAR